MYHFPIEDGMIPTSVSALNRLLVKIRKRIADGNRVLIHCYGKYYDVDSSDTWSGAPSQTLVSFLSLLVILFFTL